MAGEVCGNNGGQGIGAGHVCTCVREPGHPDGLLDPQSHGCSCGAVWRSPAPEAPVSSLRIPEEPAEFATRELVVGHQASWDVIVAALEAHGMLAVPGPVQHDDEDDGLPWWFVAPDPRKGKGRARG